SFVFMRGGAEIRSETRLRGSRTTVFLGAGPLRDLVTENASLVYPWGRNGESHSRIPPRGFPARTAGSRGSEHPSREEAERVGGEPAPGVGRSRIRARPGAGRESASFDRQRA